MPLHDDEMNMRREKREAQRRKQQAEAKRLRITLILAAVVLVLCTAGIVFLTSRSDSSQTTVAAETRPTQKLSLIHISEPTRLLRSRMPSSA